MKKNQGNRFSMFLGSQIGASTVEYVYASSILVMLVIGVSGVMKVPLVTMFDCASQKIAAYIIGGDSSCAVAVVDIDEPTDINNQLSADKSDQYSSFIARQEKRKRFKNGNKADKSDESSDFSISRLPTKAIPVEFPLFVPIKCDPDGHSEQLNELDEIVELMNGVKDESCETSEKQVVVSENIRK